MCAHLSSAKKEEVENVNCVRFDYVTINNWCDETQKKATQKTKVKRFLCWEKICAFIDENNGKIDIVVEINQNIWSPIFVAKSNKVDDGRVWKLKQICLSNERRNELNALKSSWNDFEKINTSIGIVDAASSFSIVRFDHRTAKWLFSFTFFSVLIHKFPNC